MFAPLAVDARIDREHDRSMLAPGEPVPGDADVERVRVRRERRIELAAEFRQKRGQVVRDEPGAKVGTDAQHAVRFEARRAERERDILQFRNLGRAPDPAAAADALAAERPAQLADAC